MNHGEADIISMVEIRGERDCPPTHFHPWLNTAVKEKPSEPLIESFALQRGWLQGWNRLNAYNDIHVAAPPVKTLHSTQRAEESARVRGHQQVSRCCYLSFHTLGQGNAAFNMTLFGWLRGKDENENTCGIDVFFETPVESIMKLPAPRQMC